MNESLFEGGMYTLVVTWDPRRAHATLESHHPRRAYPTLVLIPPTPCRILLLGMNQSLFEGAMYTFVIMWVPTLARMVPGGRPGEFSFDVFAPGQVHNLTNRVRFITSPNPPCCT